MILGIGWNAYKGMLFEPALKAEKSRILVDKGSNYETFSGHLRYRESAGIQNEAPRDSCLGT